MTTTAYRPFTTLYLTSHQPRRVTLRFHYTAYSCVEGGSLSHLDAPVRCRLISYNARYQVATCALPHLKETTLQVFYVPRSHLIIQEIFADSDVADLHAWKKG